MSRYTIEQVDWRDQQEQLRAIRYNVFVEEQQVPIAEEWDGRDDSAVHVLAWSVEHLPVGTARLLDTGQIGRMAVLREYRRQGIGGSMLRRLLDIANSGHVSNLFLNAQIDAVGFYQRYGFMVVGPTFVEAGIMHQKMILPPAQ